MIFEISENAETIDEEVFYQLREMIYGYSRELAEINYTSVETIFEKYPQLFTDMNGEIQDLVKLDS